VEGVEVDREEHADRDEEELRRLVDAEPQNHAQDQRKRRDVAQHLQRGVEQCFEHDAHDARSDSKMAARVYAQSRPGRLRVEPALRSCGT
jgi:hypothetical protein